MKKTTLISLMILLHSNLLSGQKSVIDSLQLIINKSSDKTTLCRTYSELSYELVYENFEEGMKYANLTIDLAYKLENDTLLAYGYNRKAMHYASKREDSLAFINIEAALDLFKKSRHFKGLAYTYFLKGWLCIERAEYTKAITSLNESIESYKNLKDDKRIAATYNSIGVAYLKLSDYHNALNAYFNNLKITENLSTSSSKGIVYGNIGIVYDKLKQFDSALEYFDKAQAEYKKTNEITRLIDNYGHIANTYDNLNNTEKALENYNTAIVIADSVKYENGQNSNLLNRAILYIKEKKYNEARPDIESAVNYYLKIEHPLNSAIALQVLSEMYQQWPDSLMTNSQIMRSSANQLAKNSAYAAVYFAKQSDNQATLSVCYENLAKALELSGLKDSALIVYKEFIALNKSITEEEIANKNASIKLSAAFEAEQREHALQAETDKQRTIKTASIIVSSTLLLLTIMILIYYKKRRDTKSKELTAHFNTVMAETEMKALRSQMNPHFIFNSLNSISLYIQKNELKLADNYLVKFAKLMRLILENSEHQKVSIKKDIEALELYMQLEQVRLKNGFSYTIKIDETINTEGTLIPPLLLQPFVENSIWHGISTIPNGHILIELQQHDDRLRCIVDDNGIGRKKTNQAKQEVRVYQSLGMKITQSRIEILNKTKQAQAVIHIFDKEHGTRIETELPLELNY